MDRTILSVDDSASFRQLVTFTLMNEGFEWSRIKKGFRLLERLESTAGWSSFLKGRISKSFEDLLEDLSVRQMKKGATNAPFLMISPQEAATMRL